MSAIATEEKRKQKIKSSIYVLSSRRDSEYKLRNKRSKEVVGPTKNAPALLWLDNPSWHYLPEGGKTAIRYIPGAPTIFEEDLWLDEKGEYHVTNPKKIEEWEFKEGLKTKKFDGVNHDWLEARKRSANLKIGFEDGFMFLDKYGDDPMLKLFVSYHHANEDAPNWRRPMNTQTLFKCVNHEEIAVKELLTVEDEDFSATYVASLRSKKGKEYSYSEANINKINATLRILELQGGHTEFDYAEKHVAIRAYAKGRPADFVRFIQEAFDEKLMAVGIAITNGAIKYTPEESEYSILTGEGEKQKWIPLLKCEAKTEEGRQEELSIYLINNPVTFRDLGFAIESAKVKAVSKKKAN